MKIIIYKNEEKVYLKIDENEKEFNFDALNELIEKLINNPIDEEDIEFEGEELVNYKQLIIELNKEVNTKEFLDAVEKAKKFGAQ
ncbi:MAG TPA: hypothetical protein GXZ57_04255 [Acholeplasmataceae bacterium]|jgi:hypothetical protein|nr:hypothetical protein [Clostridia bacterium]HHU24286.1 hypothetical protein [Acholeplasmataceae bacterium]